MARLRATPLGRPPRRLCTATRPVVAGGILLALAVGSGGAETVIPLNPRTFSADEGTRWITEAELSGRVHGNPWYIAGPDQPGYPQAWWSAVREFRDEISDSLHLRSRVLIEYDGVRSWVRMLPHLARDLDLQPGEPLRVQLVARSLEGIDELVLALDFMDRSTGYWKGWSGVFAALPVACDGNSHRATWEGTLPTFDDATAYAKIIVGCDGTYDPTAGRALLESLQLTLPRPVSPRILPMGPPGLDRSLYQRRDLTWVSRAFVCHFAFMYDEGFCEPRTGEYRLADYLRLARDQFGGFDAVVLWHAYPRIGVDDRNQFDFYRDMPGGLPGLRRLVDHLHRAGVRVFVNYNPWDTGTRREDVPDEQAIARLVKALDADGVFLDTMMAASPGLRALLDRTKPGVALEPEGSPGVEQLELLSASWAQGLPELPHPGLLRLKWIEPRHMQHQINRWASSHAPELENAFFNGSGILVWENIFGAWNPWRVQDRATLRRMAPICRLFGAYFSRDMTPFWPTLVPQVYCNGFGGKRAHVWALLNRTGRQVTEPLFLARSSGYRYFDLWNGTELRLDPPAPPVAAAWKALGGPPGWAAEGSTPVGIVRTCLGAMGCIAAIQDPALIRRVQALLPAQRAQAQQSLPSHDDYMAASSVVDPRPVDMTPAARPGQRVPGMVLVPAGPVTMNLRHPRRECGCYPDPGTPPERWYDFLRGWPFDQMLEHRIGPVNLPAFLVDECEVTNAQFAEFLKATGYHPRCATNFLKHWRDGRPPPGMSGHPVVYVDLDDARAYARWAGKRLPTELEWHRAAQGEDGRIWPWGNDYDPSRCNGHGTGTVRVGSFPAGRSPFGCYDMAGNVWEWTESERSDGHTRFCIIRGGSWYRAEGSVWYVPGGAQPNTSHTKFILLYPGLDRCSTVGFRCVKDLVASEDFAP